MPTYTNTTIWLLRRLVGSNLVSDIDAGIAALADDIDPLLTPFTQGVAASRPVSTVGTPGKAGREYYSTDTGLIEKDTGNGWLPMNSIPVVTSLPGSPTDGQEIYFLADATNGLLFHFRYRAASASAYKWEMLGGSKLYAEITTQQTYSAATYGDLTTVGPAIALPLAGDWDIAHGFTGGAIGTTACRMSYQIGATAAVDADAVKSQQSSSSSTESVSRLQRKTGLAAVTLTAKYADDASGGGAPFENRWISAIPVRVG